jgi:hypothetical protein
MAHFQIEALKAKGFSDYCVEGHMMYHHNCDSCRESLDAQRLETSKEVQEQLILKGSFSMWKKEQKDAPELHLLKPQDIRTEPLCVQCGQPERSHVSRVFPDFHAYTPPVPDLQPINTEQDPNKEPQAMVEKPKLGTEIPPSTKSEERELETPSKDVETTEDVSKQSEEKELRDQKQERRDEVTNKERDRKSTR